MSRAAAGKRKPPKPRAKKGEPSREQLMTVAIDCFARLGYQGTSIDRIARDAGVTKGALYYHFRDKEDLLFAAVKDRIGGFEQMVLEEVTPGEDPMANLRRVVDACFFHAGTLVMAGWLKPADPLPKDAHLLGWGHLFPVK